MEQHDAKIIADSLLAPAVFGEIFERHYDTVFRYAAVRVGAAHGEEVAAEVFCGRSLPATGSVPTHPVLARGCWASPPTCYATISARPVEGAALRRQRQGGSQACRWCGSQTPTPGSTPPPQQRD